MLSISMLGMLVARSYFIHIPMKAQPHGSGREGGEDRAAESGARLQRAWKGRIGRKSFGKFLVTSG